jgi:ornithine cyclodeaminase/alanine dehydrogenase-like protein (mu-crystallin family)
MREPVFVSEQDARSVMGFRDVVDSQIVAFRLTLEGSSVGGPRAVATATNGSVVAMPAWLPDNQAVGAKVLSAIPANRGRNLPVNQAIVVMFDPVDGSPCAVLDAAWLTAARTGAAAAIAAMALANSDASAVGILGSGPVGNAAIRCLLATRPVSELRLWSRDKTRAAEMAESLSRTGLTETVEVHVVGSPRAAVAGADIVVTATASPTPLLSGRDIEAGAHVSVLGGADGGREIGLHGAGRLRLVIDGWQAAWLEAGVLRTPRGRARYRRQEVVGTLGEVLNGSVLGRTDRSDITAFVSVGMAVQDITLAAEVMRRLGLGHRTGPIEDVGGPH